jgi:hypothetical protein
MGKHSSILGKLDICPFPEQEGNFSPSRQSRFCGEEYWDIFRSRGDDGTDYSFFLQKSGHCFDTDNGYFGTGYCYHLNRMSA